MRDGDVMEFLTEGHLARVARSSLMLAAAALQRFQQVVDLRSAVGSCLVRVTPPAR